MDAISWERLIWLVGAFVIVPALIEGLVVAQINDRRKETSEDPSATKNTKLRGRMRPMALAPLSVTLGFLSCAGWLSWSAAGATSVGGRFPAPTSFPKWQIALCVATLVASAVLCLWLSDRSLPSDCSVAIGVAAGFTSAVCIQASRDITGQSTIGVLMINIGLTAALFAGVYVLRRSSGTAGGGAPTP